MKRHHRHQHLGHSVHTRNRHPPLQVCHDLGAGEDIHEQLVWREDCVGLPGDAPRTLVPDIGEEREHRGLEDRNGMVLDIEHLHLRRNKVASKTVGTELESMMGVVGWFNRCNVLDVLNSVAMWLAR